MTDLLLSTRITRGDVECDVMIHFTVDHYSPGAPATWDDPADADEYEFSFLRAEFDPWEPEDAPGPLTEAEIAGLRAWFADHHDEACEVAADARSDDYYEDADRKYEQRRDELMMGDW